MNQKPHDCLCVGIIVADHVCEPIDHIPRSGELVLTRRMDLTIGGCAANVAVDLVKLGRGAAIVGNVGADIFGRHVREALDSAGVDCRHITETPDRDTSGTLIINTRGEDRRFIHSIGANGDFDGSTVTPALIRASRVLYVGGYCLMDALTAETTASLFRQAREAGVTTLLDVVIPKPDDYWPRLGPVLPVTDVFLPNTDEARVICGLDEPVAQANRFLEAGAKTVIITCGKDGAVLVNSETQCRAPGHQTEFVDGTGSGDAFTAGYIYGLLKGAAPIQCLQYGSALGASCVRAMGATTGVFTAQELERFVQSHELPIARV